MFFFLKNQKNSRPPVDLHFIGEGRQGTTRQSTSNLFFKKYISLLSSIRLIFFYLKYFIRGRLNKMFIGFSRDKKVKRKRKGVSVDQSTSYEIFEHKFLLISRIAYLNGVRLGSRPPVDLLDLQSFFEKHLGRLKWS